MTEQEWLGCEDPQLMLEFLRGKVSDRKLRLFAVGCCRNIWHLFESDQVRQAIEIVERYADGLSSNKELTDARAACRDDRTTYVGSLAWVTTLDSAWEVAQGAINYFPFVVSWREGIKMPGDTRPQSSEPGGV